MNPTQYHNEYMLNLSKNKGCNFVRHDTTESSEGQESESARKRSLYRAPPQVFRSKESMCNAYQCSTPLYVKQGRKLNHVNMPEITSSSKVSNYLSSARRNCQNLQLSGDDQSNMSRLASEGDDCTVISHKSKQMMINPLDPTSIDSRNKFNQNLLKNKQNDKARGPLRGRNYSSAIIRGKIYAENLSFRSRESSKESRDAKPTSLSNVRTQIRTQFHNNHRKLKNLIIADDTRELVSIESFGSLERDTKDLRDAED